MIKKRVLKSTGKTVYDAYVYLGTNSDTGQRDTTTIRGFASITEAKHAEADAKREYRINGKSKKEKRYKFKDIYEQWIEQHAKDISPHTLYSYQGAYRRHVAPHFDKYYIDAIDAVMCHKHLRKWETIMKSAQIPRFVVKGTLDFAVTLGLILINPMAQIQTKNRKTDKKENFYEMHELETFLRLAREQLTTNYYMAFRLMAFTGIRVGELCALGWDDVDFGAGTIHITKTITRDDKGNEYIGEVPKTNASNRQLALEQTTLQELIAWGLEQKRMCLSIGKPFTAYHDRVIVSPHYRDFINTNTVRDSLREFIRQNELKKVTPHGFRHTHCSLLIEWGYSIKKIQIQMGHAKIETTLNVYAHVTQKSNQEVAELFNEKVNF